MLVNFEVDLILIECPFAYGFILLQISLISVAVIFGIYFYYTGCFWCFKNASIDTPLDSNRCEKNIKVKLNLHVEKMDGRCIYRHDPIIIDNVQLVLIPEASTNTVDEKN